MGTENIFQFSFSFLIRGFNLNPHWKENTKARRKKKQKSHAVKEPALTTQDQRPEPAAPIKTARAQFSISLAVGSSRFFPMKNMKMSLHLCVSASPDLRFSASPRLPMKWTVWAD